MKCRKQKLQEGSAHFLSVIFHSLLTTVVTKSVVSAKFQA